MRELKRKKLLIAALVVLLLFGIWNLSWFLITKNRYHSFVEAVPKDQSGSHVIKKEDGYIYNVKLPGYLTFTWNLGITNYEKGDILIIWPLISGGYKFSFNLQKDGKAYTIYVDENMEPVIKDDEETIQLVQKFKPELDALYARAREMWSLE